MESGRSYRRSRDEPPIEPRQRHHRPGPPAGRPPAPPRVRRLWHRRRATVADPHRHRVAPLALLVHGGGGARRPHRRDRHRARPARAIPGRPFSSAPTRTPSREEGGSTGRWGSSTASRWRARSANATRRSTSRWTSRRGSTRKVPSPTCLGSQVFCGELDPGAVRDLVNGEGRSLGEALREAGLEGVPIERGEPGRHLGYVEAHIEQGPWLEHQGKRIGAVTGIVGSRNFTVSFTGQQNHAGNHPDGPPARRGARARRACPPGVRDLPGARRRAERVDHRPHRPRPRGPEQSCRDGPR